MTVPTTSNRVSYACDGVTTVFAFTFKAYDKADLRVILGGPAGSETILTLDIDYSVSISAPGPGGTVTLIGSYAATPPASGYTLTIYRELAMTQLIDLVHGDAMPPDTLEEGYDRAVMLIQQLSERIGRSILLPVSSSVTGLTLPVPDPGKILKWNDGGDGFDNVNLADLSMQAVNDYWAGVLAASGTTVADALSAMGLDPDLATLSLPPGVTISSFIKTLLDDTDAATARSTLGVSAEVPDATETVKGIAEIATQSEADAGAFDDKIITPKKLYSTPGIYRRNAIINGAMEIAQRGTSFPSAATGQFIVDRFQYVKSGTSAVHTVGQSSDAPTGVGLSNSALLDCTTADTSIDATDYSGILYFVEGYDFARFKDRQAVLSFYVKAPKAGAYCVSFMNSGNDRSYVAEYTVNQPNAWEFKSIPITFNYTGGTWNYTNGRGVGIYWMVACGSTYHTTPGAWQTGIFLATTNQVNACDSTDNDFKLTGVQLEVGSAATPFEYRPYAEELQMCQRYYEKSYLVGVTPGTATKYGRVLWDTSIANSHTYVAYAVAKRAAPTITLYSPESGASGYAYDYTVPTAVTAFSDPGATEGVNIGANAAAAHIFGAHYVADAEL